MMGRFIRDLRHGNMCRASNAGRKVPLVGLGLLLAGAFVLPLNARGYAEERLGEQVVTHRNGLAAEGHGGTEGREGNEGNEGNEGREGDEKPTSGDENHPQEPSGQDDEPQDEDVEPPQLDIVRPTGRTFGNNFYAEGKATAEVSVSSTCLDVASTTVNGVALEELLQHRGEYPKGSGITYDEWTVEEDGDLVTYATKMTYADGSYDLPLVVARDAQDKEVVDEWTVGDACLSSLVVDTTPPAISFEGVKSGESVNAETKVELSASDVNLGAVAFAEPSCVLMRVYKDGVELRRLARTVGYANARLDDRTHSYVLRIPVDVTSHDQDGSYAIEASLQDLSGNEACERIEFVVDTVAPVLDVTYNDEQEQGAGSGGYYAKPRTATITVTDKGFSAESLNAGEMVSVRASARNGHSPQDVAMGSWQEAGRPNSYARTVTFPANGTYRLSVSGADSAGNVLVGGNHTEVDDGGTYESPEFVIDNEAPKVEFAYDSTSPSPHTCNGMDFFREPVLATITVSDRNLDVSNTTVTDSQGVAHRPAWRELEQQADGTHVYVATIRFEEESAGEGSGLKHPAVRAMDLAGNTSEKSFGPFVVDQTAPVVDAVRLSKEPSTRGVEKEGDDPHLFFNEADGVPVQVTFEFSDEFCLDAAWIDDADNAYDVVARNVRGKGSGTIVLALKDHEAEDPTHDTDFERDVVLHVRDVAGNTRTWSMNREGTIDAGRDTGHKNLAMGTDGLHPVALTKDTTSPRVTLSGVEAGAYYNTPQVLHVQVVEHGFSQVKRFDPHRVVATVRKEEGGAARTQSSWHVEAKGFEGREGSYSFEQPLEVDGHYEVEASFRDYANNPSNKASIRTFTIDRTSPVISVAWDNNDVRNGSYYRAARTATVTVVEHNFSQELFSIRTTGRVGAWLSEGDTHTCKVVFADDAPPTNPHMLEVSGRDLAGNEATPYAESAFVIDTQAPTVRFLKQVSADDPLLVGDESTELLDESAFAHGIQPIVELADDANYDAAGVEVRIEGKREGTGTACEQYANVQDTGNGQRVDWGNLGLDNTGEQSYYRLSADDVYTIVACVTDKAGNTSGEQSVTFSVNRYGSNFFFEPVGGLVQGEDGSWSSAPLTEPPRIVVHEVNVSGMAGEQDVEDQNVAEQDHLVTKEYANATSVIRHTESACADGYTLMSSTQASEHNPYEGWTECVYTIQAGNFGKGSSSDYGDGGQGVYRVDVSSKDKASNNNTTADYWESSAARSAGDGNSETSTDMPREKTGTASFVLDEFGPTIEDVCLPQGIEVGGEYHASFRIKDAITTGDRIRVTVDGEQVDVYEEGASEPLGKDEAVSPGVYSFAIAAKPLRSPRSVSIRVEDYTGLRERVQKVEAKGFHVTTFVEEGLVAAVVLGLGTGVIVLVRKRRS